MICGACPGWSLDEMKHLAGLLPQVRGIKRDRLSHCIGDKLAAAVDACPARLAASGIDFEKLHTRRHLCSVANNAPQYPVIRRAHWRIPKMANDEIFEGA